MHNCYALPTGFSTGECYWKDVNCFDLSKPKRSDVPVFVSSDSLNNLLSLPISTDAIASIEDLKYLSARQHLSNIRSNLYRLFDNNYRRKKLSNQNKDIIGRGPIQVEYGEVERYY